MIILISGEQGTGKSLTLTHYLYKHYNENKKFKILTNYNIKIKHEKLDLVEEFNNYILNSYFNNNKKTKIKNSIIGIDEGDKYFDARRSMGAINIFFSWFFTQARKRNIYIYITTQHIENVEIRIRKETNFIYYPKCLFKINDKFIHISPAHVMYLKLNGINLIPDLIENYIYKYNFPFREFITTEYINPKNIFNLYNSDEIIFPIWNNLISLKDIKKNMKEKNNIE